MSDEQPSDVDPRQERWRTGSYEIVGDWFRSASVRVLDGFDVAGSRVLDLATGTGAVSIEAARQGATVTAVDLTPELLEIARHRASDAGVTIEFVEGDFDNVRLDQPADLVTSSFGVIFSPDPSVTAAAIARYVRPGGHVAINAWVHDGAFGELPAALVDLLVEAPPSIWRRWSTRAGLDAAFDEKGITVVEQREDVVVISFDSSADAADQMIRWSGGFAQLFASLENVGMAAVGRHVFIEHLERFGVAPAVDDGRFHLGVRHVVSVLAADS